MLALVSLIISGIVACVVVYRDLIRPRIVRPQLEVQFSLKEPISRQTLVNRPTAPDESKFCWAFWPRLRVINVGKATARKCEGVLTEVRTPDGMLDTRFDPLTLRWAIALPQEASAPLDIAPKRTVDLNTVTTIDGEAYAYLAVHRDARYAPMYLEPGDYWFRVVIYGENFKPVSRGYALQWDGKNYMDIRMQEMNEQSSEHCWPWPLLRG